MPTRQNMLSETINFIAIVCFKISGRTRLYLLIISKIAYLDSIADTVAYQLTKRSPQIQDFMLEI